jgi:hypothetical protein
METVTDKKFLTSEEKALLTALQQKTQSIVMEFGEIEMIRTQLNTRHESVKNSLKDLSSQEKDFTNSIFEKYGKCNIDPETGEITLVG